MGVPRGGLGVLTVHVPLVLVLDEGVTARLPRALVVHHVDLQVGTGGDRCGDRCGTGVGQVGPPQKSGWWHRCGPPRQQAAITGMFGVVVPQVQVEVWGDRCDTPKKGFGDRCDPSGQQGGWFFFGGGDPKTHPLDGAVNLKLSAQLRLRCVVILGRKEKG